MSTTKPSRGEVWLADLDPTVGHEQAGRRPSLVISDDRLNHSAAGLCIVIPITSKNKGQPLHVPVLPPEGGLTKPSFIKCEDMRSVAVERLLSHYGQVLPATMTAVEDRLRLLLKL
jgi:mRNA interferase MazF